MKTVQRTDDRLDRYSGLELRHLRLVRTVAEEGGLTRAAQRMRLTPSALSHQLRHLEAVVGGPLFHREGRSMRLTPAGDVLLETAVRVVGLIADAEDRLTHQQAGLAGTVRLATHCYTGYQWLPAVVRPFVAQFPAAGVRVVAEATRRPIEALLAKEIDVGITTERPARPGLQCRPVFRDEVKLVLAADHPLAARSSVSLEDIARQHLISYSTAPEHSAFCVDLLRPAGLWPARFTSIQLTEAIIEMVRAGLGVTVLAEWAIHDRIGDGLVTRRIMRGGWRRTWYAVTWPPPAAGPLVNEFVRLMAEVFRAGAATRQGG